MNLSERDEKRLVGVHPDLAEVVRRAAELMPEEMGFIVTEGLRTQNRQAELVKAGASRTMNSRHLTGHAVDLAATVGGEVRWDWSLYLRLAAVMGLAAEALNVPVVWGGTWKRLEARTYGANELSRSFPDGPHYELMRGGEYA